MSVDRRQILTTTFLTGAATVLRQITSFEAKAVLPGEDAVPSTTDIAEIDFRYSPCHWQTTFCFPDDEYKSLVGDRGALMYEFSQNKFADPREFGTVVEFTLEACSPTGSRDKSFKRPASRSSKLRSSIRPPQWNWLHSQPTVPAKDAWTTCS